MNFGGTALAVEFLESSGSKFTLPCVCSFCGVVAHAMHQSRPPGESDVDDDDAPQRSHSPNQGLHWTDGRTSQRRWAWGWKKPATNAAGVGKKRAFFVSN